jgi:hypothetical protein
MPQLIDIPGKGVVEFPDGMSDAAITQAIRRDSLLSERDAAAKTGRRADAVAGVAGALHDYVAQPLSDPFGPVVRGVGEGLNALGRLSRAAAVDVMEGRVLPSPHGLLPDVEFRNAAGALLRNEPPNEENLTTVQKGLADAAQTLPTIIGGMAATAAGVPAPLAFGGAMGSSAYAESGQPLEAAKAAAIGAVIPGAAALARQGAAKGLGAAVERGLLSGNATMAHKAAEALTAQGAVQVLIEGMNLPEYWQMNAEQRKEALIRNLVANTAFLALDVPYVFGRGPSVTQGEPRVKVAQMAEAIMQDPVALDAMRQRVDDAVFDALNPRRAQVTTDGTPPAAPPDLVRLGDLPAVDTPPADVLPSGRETITGSNEGKASEMPAEPGASPGPSPSSPPPRAPRRRPTQDRPWDIIDEIEHNIGRLRGLKSSRPGEEGYYSNAYRENLKYGPIRALFSNAGGTSSMDSALEALRRSGWMPESATVDDLHQALFAANMARRDLKGRRRAAQEHAKREEAQRVDFEQQAFRAPARGADQIPVNDLLVGDELQIAGTKFRVKDMVFDPDTLDLAYVVMEDGNRFGVQTVGPDQVISITKGTLKPVSRDVEFGPVDEAPPQPGPPPKLRQMEDQGDLLSTQSEDFKLAGEKATDFERIQREREAAEEARRQAAKGQTDMFAEEYQGGQQDAVAFLGSLVQAELPYGSTSAIPQSPAKPVGKGSGKAPKPGAPDPQSELQRGPAGPADHPPGYARPRAISAEQSAKIADTIRHKVEALEAERAQAYRQLEQWGRETTTHRDTLARIRHIDGQLDALRTVFQNFKDSPETAAGHVFASLRSPALPRPATQPAPQSLGPRQIDPAAPRPDLSQPVSLASIREYLSKALDIPVRMGVRVPGGIRRALGLFFPNRETIRLKAINDIPTLAHEVGHYLHYILFPGAGDSPTSPRASHFNKQFDSELMPLGQQTSLPSYKPPQVRKEGVAEFVREYLTDRTAAEAKAPKFTQFFEGELQGKFPDIWNVVDQARADLRAYIQQPALSKVRSMISSRPEEKGRPLQDRLQKLYDDWVNELAPIDRAMDRLVALGLPEGIARRMSSFAVNYIGGWRGKVEHSLKRQQIDFQGNEVGPSLREILGGIESLDDFRAYIVSKRVIEKARQGKETGFHPDDAREVVREFEKKYERHRIKLRQFLRNELQMLKDSGIISQADLRKMESMNEDYIPFHRVYDTVGGRRGGTGKGFVDLPAPLRRFKGDTRQIIDPLESIVKNMYLYRDLAERNRVARAFVGAVESVRGGGRVGEEIARKIKPIQVNDAELRTYLKELGILPHDVKGAKVGGIPEVDMALEGRDLAFKIWRAARTESPADGVFKVFKNGKDHYYQIDDPELYRALQLQDSSDAQIFTRFAVLKPLRFLTRTLRAGATLTLEFMARNPFRDQITAAVYSKYGYVPFWDGFRGMLSAVKRDDLYWNWVKSGGRYADFISTDRMDLTKTLDQVIDNPGMAARAREWANPIRTLQKWSELMETATRLSEFRRAKERGASDLEAANAAKDVTLNFSRFGFQGKLYNQLSAFFNAAIQDVDKFSRSHAERPVSTTLKAFAYITTPSLVAWYLGRDDKAIQELPEWRKNTFWNVNVAKIAREAGIEMDDYVLSFPKPFLLGQIYGSSVERGLDLAYGKDPNAVRKWLDSTLEQMPLGFDLLPTGVRPFVENWANRSFFRNAPLEGQALQQLPASERTTPDTSQAARLVAKYAALVSNGELQWSPVKFDNFTRGVLGGLGRYGTDAIDYALVKSQLIDVPPPPAKDPGEWPLLRAFTQSPYQASAYVQRFYEGADLAESRVNSLRTLAENMGASEHRFWANDREATAFYVLPAGRGGKPMISHLRTGRERLNEIHKAMSKVQESRELTPDEKRERLSDLNRVRNDVAKFLYETTLAPADRKKVY